MAYATNQDVQLYYETFGNPSDPAILLINGLGSQCINYKPEWCEMFVAAGYFVIRFDNRDVGLSTKLEGAGDPPYLVGDMAADAVAVLDAAGVDRAHVVGFSMGGMIAQQLAIAHADRLLSMTSVMSSTGDADVGRSSPEALAILMSPSPPDRDGAMARHVEGNRIYGSPAEFDEERLRANAAAAYDRANCPEGVARQMRAILASGSRTADLATVAVPTLVLHGDQDRLVDISGGRRTAESIPGARFVAIEGMGHDYPPAYWEQIVSLVTDHAAAADGRMPA